jgi:hypothetical protein
MNRQPGRFDFPGLSHNQKVMLSIQPNNDFPESRYGSDHLPAKA